MSLEWGSVMRYPLDRREALTGLGALATAGVWRPTAALADEPPPETTTIRLGFFPSICIAPQYVAEALLRLEGFTDIRYVVPEGLSPAGAGEIDFDMRTGPFAVARLDAGDPIVVLAGVHVGCYELFAHEPVQTLSDLRGRRIMVPYLGTSGHLLLAAMLAHVGIDPRHEIEWQTGEPGPEILRAFIGGEVDALLGFPPEPQELRQRGIGRVILNTALDRPWSQYFCCTVIGNQDWVERHPVATKRYLRAVLKATDLCASDPELAAQRLIEGGFTGSYDYALQTLNEVAYDRWRDYDLVDALRFYALRLHEGGLIEKTPQQLLANGVDVRFFEALRQELRL